MTEEVHQNLGHHTRSGPVAHIPLAEWAAENKPPEDMLWRGSYWAQIQFFRDTLRHLLSGLNPEKNPNAKKWECPQVEIIPIVVGSHWSKSILCPCVEYRIPAAGLTFVIRDNFHDYKLTVESKFPVEVDLEHLPVQGYVEGIHSCYFEGFPKDRVHPPYQENSHYFSLGMRSEYTLWTVLFLIAREAFRRVEEG